MLKSTTIVHNMIDNEERPAISGATMINFNPHTGMKINELSSSAVSDVNDAVDAARAAFFDWSQLPAVTRGDFLFKICQAIEDHTDEIAAIVAEETGKKIDDARGEVGGAIQCGRFFAGEGTRLFGRTMPSGTVGKYNSTVRQPIGVAGLIIASNTPIANVAWKLFPALICGNAVVMKAAETAPGTAMAVARLAVRSGLPRGVFNLVQGSGLDAGAPLVEHPKTDVISFTGSSNAGQQIAESCATQLKKVSLELGGKNPFVVCSDADLNRAVRWACLSIYSNAGQRCAAASRLLIQDEIYEDFRERLVEATQSVSLGVGDNDMCGPVISQNALDTMLSAIGKAKQEGAKILAGGKRADCSDLKDGYYMTPTLIEDCGENTQLSQHELFGPIGVLQKFSSYTEALELANNSPYGLTACIHTSNIDRAIHFAHHVSTGVAVINAGTYGSEPHMPFGGLRQSGNGTREPGTEALDIYSSLKDIYIVTETTML